MSTPSDSIATDASVVDDDASIARRATDDFLSDAVSALRVSSREPATVSYTHLTLPTKLEV